MIALVLCLFLGSGNGDIQIENVEHIEVNRLLNKKGEVTLTQVIYWRFSKVRQRPECRAWRKEDSTISRSIQPGRVVEFFSYGNQIRRVVAQSISFTWTEYDPESFDRTITPSEMRVPMFPPKLKAKDDDNQTSNDNGR